jgi:hypothetical protein
MQPRDSASLSLAWAEEADGALVLSVRAVRMRMATLVTTIVLIVFVFGAVAVGALILLDTNTDLAVGRSLVVMVSGAIGIVASIGLIATMRARRRLWRIRLDERSVTVVSGRFSWSLPLSELRLVRLRRHTDYARLVIVGETSRLSLLAGLGLAPDPRDTESAYLPKFPSEVQNRFRRTGLSERRSPRAPDLFDWTRSAEPQRISR